MTVAQPIEAASGIRGGGFRLLNSLIHTASQVMNKAKAADVRAEVEKVQTLNKDELRAWWRKMFGKEPPPALTKDLLGRMIAWRIQEKIYGGHDKATIKLLERLARGESASVDAAHRLKPGTVLMREHRGVRHTVTVVADGFVWNEQTHASLSTIARTITGTSWNGPRFFGLRTKHDAKQMAEQ